MRAQPPVYTSATIIMVLALPFSGCDIKARDEEARLHSLRPPPSSPALCNVCLPFVARLVFV